MPIRPFRPEDAPALAELSARCARTTMDFVLNPLWETADELHAEFERFGIDPAEHLLVAESGDGRVVGNVGFLRRPGEPAGALICPIVAREERGHGLGGELLRAGLRHGHERLHLHLVTAGVGTRNRYGYSLLQATGFRPGRQYFFMRCAERPRVPRMSKFEFAEAKPEDAERILEIYHACGFEERGLERMREFMDDGRHDHVVARDGGEIVAFAELETHWPTRPWVAFVGVLPARRARGLGSALVAWALARHFRRGATAAQLLLSPANRNAVRAYEKVGFKRHRVVDVLDLVM